ncbi:MAG: hypothetical protein LUE64_03220 [Candidatus Gastranaerophilales bacterium]|nr:hypothetical protein [Candidatus Gastranaerophilales bacterium]
MDNLEELLKKVEANHENLHKKEKINCTIAGHTYEVILLSRKEKAELIFDSEINAEKNLKNIYKWLKPTIYRSFQLKDLAVKARENGLIDDYYGIIDMLFEPNEILEIIDFILESNNLKKLNSEVIELQKK